MRYRTQKSFTFQASHALEAAYAADCDLCIHEHCYRVEMLLSCERLDDSEMVIDSAVFETFKRSIKEVWDKGLLIHKSQEGLCETIIDSGGLQRKKVTYLDCNPSSEVLASLLFERLSAFVQLLAGDRVRVDSVILHDTPTSYAEVCRG